MVWFMISVDREALWISVQRLLESDIDGRTSVDARDATAVMSADRHDVAEWVPLHQVCFATALARSLLYSGSVHEAVDVAVDAVGALRALPDTSRTGLLVRCITELAGIQLLVGDARRCAELSRRALDHVEHFTDAHIQYRARCLLAAALAVNGEFIAASEACESADLLGREVKDMNHGGVMSLKQRPWPRTVADLFLACRIGDDESLAAIDQAVPSTSPVAFIGNSIRELARGELDFLRRDYQSVVAVMENIIHGVLGDRYPPLILGRALELQALSFIQLGQPAEALRVLEGRVSLPRHSVCFEFIKANAILQLGQPRKALLATDQCLRDPGHSLRSLPSIHLRRAVAFELISAPETADMEFSSAAHLAVQTGGLSPAVGLPQEQLGKLLRRLIAHEPAFGQKIVQRIPLDGDYPEPKRLGIVPVSLTEREGHLANWLATELTIPEIAEGLFLSINTVKTELRRLYRKLGVSSREDAVDALRHLVVLHDPRV